MLALAPGEVHLWLAHYDRIDDARELDDCLRLLSESERAQMNRFVFAKDRRRHLVTRALVRRTLSRYLPGAAAEWQFTSNEYGRPELAAVHANAASLSFNVSHTHSLIALAITAGGAVGVDVENVVDRDVPLEVAHSYFSAREAGALARLRPAEQPLRFFEYWTLKESYIKARGLGLSIPLEKFSFSFPAEHEVEFATHPELGDDGDRWFFWQLQPSDDYLLSICVEKAGEATPRLVLQPEHPPAMPGGGARLRRASRGGRPATSRHGVDSAGTL